MVIRHGTEHKTQTHMHMQAGGTHLLLPIPMAKHPARGDALSREAFCYLSAPPNSEAINDIVIASCRETIRPASCVNSV